MRQLVTGIVFLAIFAMATRFSLDSDTWWHLRTGQEILSRRQIVLTDPFSYTRKGAEWHYPGWLVEIPLAAIFSASGAGALNLLTAGVVTLAFFFVWQTLSGGVFLRAFTVILAAAASGIYWAARPYMLSFLMAAVFLMILEAYRWSDPVDHCRLRKLFWLPLLMVVWANSHGGFIVGLILLGIYLIEASYLTITAHSKLKFRDSRLSMLVLISLLCICAVCLNPSGPVMLLYPFKTIGIETLKGYIQEWQPPDFGSAQVAPFSGLLLLILAALGVSRKRIALSDFLLLAVFTCLALQAARNIAFFAIVAPVVITRHLAPVTAALERHYRIRPGGDPEGWKQRSVNLLLLVMLSFAVFFKSLSVLPNEANSAEIQKSMPVDAVEWIQSARPVGRMFNSYNWGGYLLWVLPQYPVFIDGRTDLYDDALVNEWIRVVQAKPGWQEVLERWEVGWVLVEPGLPIISRLDEIGWRRVYEDKISVVMVKDQ